MGVLTQVDEAIAVMVDPQIARIRAGELVAEVRRFRLQLPISGTFALRKQTRPPQDLFLLARQTLDEEHVEEIFLSDDWPMMRLH